MIEHPYIRYAEALTRVEHNLDSSKKISPEHLLIELERGLLTFRMRTSQSYEGRNQVIFEYVKKEKGNPSSGIFLSQSVISSDARAKDIWGAAHKIIEELKQNPLFEKKREISMSIAPTSGEYTNFAIPNKGKPPSVGRGKAKDSFFNIVLSVIATLSPNKPSLRAGNDNFCIIPDVPIELMMDFIVVFKRMLLSRTTELMIGNVHTKQKGKGKNRKTVYEPKRPLIFKGNFPNPPKSSALCGVALLAAIGEFAKEAEVSTIAHQVLDSLKGAPIYMIKYGGGSTFTFNHHVVDLAKDGKLSQIVDSIYYSQLYGEGRRTNKSTKYQKFDLFSSRFLQLFNKSAFQDFLAFRAEYPYVIEILFNNYFKKIEMIDPNVVSSARDLGRWLNQVAYFAAQREVGNGSKNKDEIRKVKAKVLVELESSTFSAKSGDALIAQVITRAGRLSMMDAPSEATLFMQETASGNLSLDKAKNLLIAFSRLKNKREQKEELIENGDGNPSEDLSNI